RASLRRRPRREIGTPREESLDDGQVRGDDGAAAIDEASEMPRGDAGQELRGAGAADAAVVFRGGDRVEEVGPFGREPSYPEPRQARALGEHVERDGVVVYLAGGR